MIPTAHFGEPTAQQPSLVWDASPPAFAGLGSQRSQSPALNIHELVIAPVALLDFLTKKVIEQPSKLAILKKHKFTAEGREQRIKVSLDALNTPEPITLNLEQWKEVVAEAEEEDDED